MRKLAGKLDDIAFWSDWADEPVAVTGNQVISRQQLLQQAVKLSRQLPEHQYVINLCKDRYHFAVAFLAVLLKNQTSILPSNNAPKNISDLIEEYADSYLVGDEQSSRNYQRYYSVSPLQSDSSENDAEVVELGDVLPIKCIKLMFR